jgi:hypothetical protein
MAVQMCISRVTTPDLPVPLLANPTAAPLIRARPSEMSRPEAWANTELVAELLLKGGPQSPKEWMYLSGNRHDRAVSELLAHPERINWGMFMCNTNGRAIDEIRNNPTLVDRRLLLTNPCVFELYYPDDWKLDPASFVYLNDNPCVLAIEYLLNKPDLIAVSRLAQNPGVFEYDPRVQAVLESLPK